MSVKELLYIEDMLGHLRYLSSHLGISEDCLDDEELSAFLKKINKKVSLMYDTYYSLLGGN